MLIAHFLTFLLLRILLVNCDAMEDFFPDIHGNLTKVSWAHAVNNQQLLQEALNDSTIMMLEADILIGKLNGQGEDIPIMGHPPSTSSDLSLEQFFNKIYNFNVEAKNQNITGKGVKLDFKSIEAFQGSVGIINKLYSIIDYPVWINADIISGPLNSTTVPVDPDRFLQGAKNFTRSILSLGWTTNYGIFSPKTQYTEEQISNMIKAIQRNAVVQEITFAIRAGISAESFDQILKLTRTLEQAHYKCTLTLWSSSNDPVDVEKLRKLIFAFGLDKMYIDVPKELMDKLNLGNSTTAQ